MTNTVMHERLINYYNKTSFTHHYIFGFELKGNIYAVATTKEVLPFITTVESAGKNNGLALKYKPNTTMKMMLMGKGAKVVCSVEYFNQLVADSKYNKGEIFERLITEANGQTWVKDNVPYTKDGDLTIGKIAYQIK